MLQYFCTTSAHYTIVQLKNSVIKKKKPLNFCTPVYKLFFLGIRNQLNSLPSPLVQMEKVFLSYTDTKSLCTAYCVPPYILNQIKVKKNDMKVQSVYFSNITERQSE